MNAKTKKILMWVCIALLSLLFLGAGGGKLAGQATENFARWGYSTTLMYLIGVMELLGAIGLWIPLLRKWAAMGLIGIMIGAAYTHILNGEYLMLILNTVMAILALGVIWLSDVTETKTV